MVNLHEFAEKDDWIHVIRPFSRTTVTFKMISIEMRFLTLEAVKNVRIHLGQLRIKTQID